MCSGKISLNATHTMGNSAQCIWLFSEKFPGYRINALSDTVWMRENILPII